MCFLRRLLVNIFFKLHVFAEILWVIAVATTNSSWILGGGGETETDRQTDRHTDIHTESLHSQLKTELPPVPHGVI